MRIANTVCACSTLLRIELVRPACRDMASSALCQKSTNRIASRQRCGPALRQPHSVHRSFVPRCVHQQRAGRCVSISQQVHCEAERCQKRPKRNPAAVYSQPSLRSICECMPTICSLLATDHSSAAPLRGMATCVAHLLPACEGSLQFLRTGPPRHSAKHTSHAH